MCVNYASEVLRAASELVLNNAAARYGHENPVPHERMWQFSMEQLGVWNRRRGLPLEPAHVEDEDVFEWLQ